VKFPCNFGAMLSSISTPLPSSSCSNLQTKSRKGSSLSSPLYSPTALCTTYYPAPQIVAGGAHFTSKGFSPVTSSSTRRGGGQSGKCGDGNSGSSRRNVQRIVTESYNGGGCLSSAAVELEQAKVHGLGFQGVGFGPRNTHKQRLGDFGVNEQKGRWLRRLGHERMTNTDCKKARSVSPKAILQWNRRPVYAGVAPRVIVITSGKGGVGKTTTTANLGMCLARLNFKVVAIDADVGLRNLDLLLGLENRVNYTAMEVLNGECRLDQALIRDKRWTNFELLCINKPRYKMPLGFGGKALTWLVDALKKRTEGCPDFILIDCPAGIDAGFITAITPASEAVLVTTPDITSLRDADRVTGLLECDGIKDIKMVVNRVRSDMIKGEDMMSVLDVQEMLGLPLLGVVPEDSEVIKSTNRGYPLVLKKPPTLAGLALEQAAWRLVEQDSMKAVLIEEQSAKRSFFSSFLGG
jgi:septum site-determining protein MinD